MLREAQAERKTQETREQEAVYEVGLCHLVAGKKFSPAEFGTPGTSIANPAGPFWHFPPPPGATTQA